MESPAPTVREAMSVPNAGTHWKSRRRIEPHATVTGAVLSVDDSGEFRATGKPLARLDHRA